MKNILPSIGIIASLAGAWQILHPIYTHIWYWIIFFGIVWMTLGHVTDFRDIEGDNIIGRQTFPIAFGENNSRILISVGFGLLPLITHFVLLVPSKTNLTVYLWDIVIAVVSWIIAFRILAYRTQKASEQTYYYFTSWYSLTLISTIFVIRI